MAKSKSKQEEALQLLDALDSFTPPPAAGNKPRDSAPEGQEAEVLAFLEEITQKSAEPTLPRSSTPASAAHIDRPSRVGTPVLKKSTERVRLGGGSASSSTTSLHKTGAGSNFDNKANADQTPKQFSSPDIGSGAWGWGSVWSTASAAIKQAKTAVDEQVRAIPNNEHARKWGEGVIEYARNAQLDKLGSYLYRYRPEPSLMMFVRSRF